MTSSVQGNPGIMFYIKLAVLYVGLWALVSQNQGWEFGVPVIMLAVWCAYKTRLRMPALALQHLPAFLFFFLQRVVAGGVDVALRTVSFKPAVNPGWDDYELRTNSSQVSLSLSAIVGLLPGTLAAKIENNVMKVHLLNVDSDWQTDVKKLESHIALLFNTSVFTEQESKA